MARIESGIEQRRVEAADALASLDELTGKTELSPIERDGAILRLVCTFEAAWRLCMLLLAEYEGIIVASPNAAIRAARDVRWLDDEDTQAALALARDRGLALRNYSPAIGDMLGGKLRGYAALLRRWLTAMQERPGEP